MPSRKTLALLFALAAPAVTPAQEREWVEDYTQGWNDDGRTQQPVDVEMDAEATQPPPTVQSFQSELSPYGAWVSTSRYGSVWRPHVAADWRPYYYGRWEWTNEGWLWVSEEPFGWAVYHYGRWAYEPGYGWIWVPGYQWAPAWVTWRTSGDVVGWAPLAPGFSLYVSSYPFVDYHWTFVPCVQFVSYPVYRYAYPPNIARQYYGRTAPAPARPAPRPGTAYPSPRPAPQPAWGGPSPRVVEERIGRPISPLRVVSAPRPGATARPGEVAIYRPRPAPSARVSGRDGEVRGAAPAPAPRASGQDTSRQAAPSYAPAPSRRQGEATVAPSRSSPPAPSYAPAPSSRGSSGSSSGSSSGGSAPRGGGGGGSRPAPSPGHRGR